MKKIIIIIKYFPANSRISGLTSFVSLVVDCLADKIDLHIYSACSSKIEKEISLKKNYTLHSIKKPFWINVFKEIKDKHSSIVLISGVYEPLFLIPILALCLNVLKSEHLFFLQGTVFKRNPNYFLVNLLKKFKVIITTNRKQAKVLSEKLERNCFYLSPGIDTKKIKASQHNSKKKLIRIGFINHLNKVKGADLALKAFDRLKFEDTEYVVAGTGDLEKKLKKKYLSNKNIVFYGYCENVVSLIKSCDFIVLPFRQSDSVLGISQTVLESMSCGVPIIGSNVDVITSVIIHNKNGLIFKDFDELLTHIKKLHDDSDARKKLSLESFKVSSEYEIKLVANKLLKIIEREKDGSISMESDSKLL